MGIDNNIANVIYKSQDFFSMDVADVAKESISGIFLSVLKEMVPEQYRTIDLWQEIFNGNPANVLEEYTETIKKILKLEGMDKSAIELMKKKENIVYKGILKACQQCHIAK